MAVHGREDLLALLDRCVGALGAGEPAGLPLAPGARYAENCVEMPLGDGAWHTVTALGDTLFSLCDPESRQAARFGSLEESGDHALYAMRIAVDEGGALTEIELLACRPDDCGVPFMTADIPPREEIVAAVPQQSRADRARLLELANGYFDTLQQNDGTLHTRFHPDCQRRENGVQTTSNPRHDIAPIAKIGCEEQFRLGYYLFDDWIRARRYPLVDEEQGIVLAGGFIDHDGRTREYTLTNGETRTGFFLRPHSFAFLEAFKIRDDAIAAVEAVFHFVPYRMKSPWAEDGADPRVAN